MIRSTASTLAAILVLGGCAGAESEQVRVLEDVRAVEFSAIVDTEGFTRAGDMSGYHFIVWDNGRAAEAALLRARVSDVQVLEAIESLGARPGDGLPTETWTARHDTDDPAPYETITGPPVRIEILVPDRETPLTLKEILEDPGGMGFDMRFGGHRANIPEWRSGCVVCLFSCPGSKVGNARYTVRDFVEEDTGFRPRTEVLPADGTEVTVRLTLAGGGA